MHNSYGAKGTLSVSGSTYGIFRLAACGPGVARLPMSLKILLENLLRTEDGRVVRRERHRGRLALGPHQPSPPGDRLHARAASSCRTSPACPPSSISPPCATR